MAILSHCGIYCGIYSGMRTGWIAAVVTVAAIGCGSSSTETKALPADEARDVLIDRNWIDVWPKSKTERLHVYRFTPSMGGGVYQDRTLYKGTFELFRFETVDGAIDFDLPETEQKLRAKYRIEKVDGPDPFDLKLTLEPSPRGPSVYFGRSAETAAEAEAFRWPLPRRSDD